MKRLFLFTLFCLILAIFFAGNVHAQTNANINSSWQIILSERKTEVLNVFNIVPYEISFLVKNGISLNYIFLILVFPIIVTVISFFKQIVGIKTLGIYIPSIITLSFLVLGIKIGLAVFIITLFVGILTKFLIRKVNILHASSIAIILTVISVVVFILLIVGVTYYKKEVATISIFPALVIGSLIEKFIINETRKGLKNTCKLALQTIILVIICYFIVLWEPLKIFIIKYPEIIILFILINFFIGRWTGLRFLEYVRFWKIINQGKK